MFYNNKMINLKKNQIQVLYFKKNINFFNNNMINSKINIYFNSNKMNNQKKNQQETINFRVYN